MEHGLIVRLTDTFGFPMQRRDFLPMQQMVIGLIQIMVGHGSLTILGVGHLSIMEDGILIRCTARVGYRVMNGDRVGSLGDTMMDIMDGHQWARVRIMFPTTIGHLYK